MSAYSKISIVCGGTKTQPLHEHPCNVTFSPEFAFCSGRSTLLKTRCPSASYTSMCSKRVEMQQTYRLSAFAVWLSAQRYSVDGLSGTEDTPNATPRFAGNMNGRPRFANSSFSHWGPGGGNAPAGFELSLQATLDSPDLVSELADDAR